MDKICFNNLIKLKGLFSKTIKAAGTINIIEIKIFKKLYIIGKNNSNVYINEDIKAPKKIL
jgi:hypothetical protein